MKKVNKINKLNTSLQIRKWYTQIEDTLANESGVAADGAPLRKIVIACAVHNPYAMQPGQRGKLSRKLSAIVEPSLALGAEFGRRIRAQMQAMQAELGVATLESYGKACLVGMAGEYEHGNAFLTSAFADPVRAAIGGGLSWVPSTGKRGGPGTEIDVPLAHRNALYVRSHYDTISCSFGDAPAPDEVLVIFAFASRGRLHARLGGLQADAIQGKDGLR
jgi:hypothetical protein